jgi:hypothetical protein
MAQNPRRLINSLLHYDIDTYPFTKMFKDSIYSFLKKKGISRRPELDQLHHVVDSPLLSDLYKWLYAMLNGPELQRLYRRYIEKEIAPIFPSGFVYQWIPNPRIQMPHGRTVQYHTDEWYGHGPGVFNFWMPITRAYGSNTLLAASRADSLKWCKRFEREKLPQQEINRRSATLVRAVECGPGSVYVFNAQCIHGTEQNRTTHTRISMDFRILRHGELSGDKPITEYFRSLSQSKGPVRRLGQKPRSFAAAAYIYPRYGFTKFVSQPNQRLIIDAFAKRRNAVIVDEETEIRTMAHHPALLQLATGSGLERINAVILYSVLCLPPGVQDRMKIYRTAKKSGVRLFFANEALEFPNPSSEAILEKRHRQLIRA